MSLVVTVIVVPSGAPEKVVVEFGVALSGFCPLLNEPLVAVQVYRRFAGFPLP